MALNASFCLHVPRSGVTSLPHYNHQVLVTSICLNYLFNTAKPKPTIQNVQKEAGQSIRPCGELELAEEVKLTAQSQPA